MNRKISKFICAMLIVLTLTNTIGEKDAFAGLNKPSDEWSLVKIKNGGNGKYTGSGECKTTDLYSNYNFTGVASMKITVTNESVKNNIKVKIYRNKKYFDTCISTVEVPKNGKTTWTIETNSSYKYYVKFIHPADFKWTIKKGN